jgi:hypothetical protein
MKYVLNMAATAAALSLVSVASSASATTYEVTNVVLNPGGSTLSVHVNNDMLNLHYNNDSALAGAIGLTVTGDPKTLWVFCVDLFHEINLGGHDPALAYQFSPVITDSSFAKSGMGNTLSTMTPNVQGEIATLAGIGVQIANLGLGNQTAAQLDDLTAIQGAIWTVEYGATVTSLYDPTVNADMASYVAYAEAHPQPGGDPYGFYSYDASTQGFGTSQGFTSGVPEPATWAMMIVGIGGVGAGMRGRRRSAMVTQTA